VEKNYKKQVFHTQNSKIKRFSAVKLKQNASTWRTGVKILD
jgi:hypothetical protein